MKCLTATLKYVRQCWQSTKSMVMNSGQKAVFIALSFHSRNTRNLQKAGRSPVRLYEVPYTAGCTMTWIWNANTRNCLLDAFFHPRLNPGCFPPSQWLLSFLPLFLGAFFPKVRLSPGLGGLPQLHPLLSSFTSKPFLFSGCREERGKALLAPGSVSGSEETFPYILAVWMSRNEQASLWHPLSTEALGAKWVN